MIVREYKSGDETSITELFLIASPRHLRNQVYWKWSNLWNPNGKSLSLVVEEENEIIAHYSILPYKINVDNAVVLGGLAQQAVVHPFFRNLKVFISLTDKVWEKAVGKFQFIYGFPSNDKILTMYQMLMNFKKIDEFLADVISIPTVIKVLKYNSFQRFTIKRINKFPLEINKWLNKNKNNKIYPLKSAELLNWRFFAHPLHYYFVFGVFDDEIMVGYMVFKIYWDGKQTIGHFIDFDVKNNNEEYLLSLTEHVSLFSMRCKITNIVFWNKQSECSDIFNQFGIKKGGFKINFCIKFLNNKIRKKNKLLLDKSKWSFTMASTDAF